MKLHSRKQLCAAGVAFLTLVPLLAQADAAAVPNWTQQSYYIYQDIQAFPNSDLITDDQATSMGALNLSNSISDSTATTSGSATTSFGYSNGVFSMGLSAMGGANGDTSGNYGYALSDVGMDNYFVATTSVLYVYYSITGTMYSNNRSSALAYSDISGSGASFLEDQSLPLNQRYGSRQDLTWLDLYDDNIEGFNYSLDTSGVSVLNLIPGHTYRFALGYSAEGLGESTSTAGVDANITFSFSTTPVPEPGEAGMMAAGLLCLAGLSRLKSRRSKT